MIIKHLKTKGFTILEVIVALGILSMGLLGISSLVVQNLQAQNINQNYLIASMLAQEGAELVRNKRDFNWIRNTWTEWAESDAPNSSYDILQTAGAGVYSVDYSGAITLVTDHSSAGTQLSIDGLGFYSHAGGSNTPFSRLVRVTNNIDSLDIQVEVQWQERGRTHNYDVNFELYNWR